MLIWYRYFSLKWKPFIPNVSLSLSMHLLPNLHVLKQTCLKSVSQTLLDYHMYRAEYRHMYEGHYSISR